MQSSRDPLLEVKTSVAVPRSADAESVETLKRSGQAVTVEMFCDGRPWSAQIVAYQCLCSLHLGFKKSSGLLVAGEPLKLRDGQLDLSLVERAK